MKRTAFVAALLLVGCGATVPRGTTCRELRPVEVARPEGGPHPTRNIILVTIDGVRWQEIFGGVDATRGQRGCDASELVPNLTALGQVGLALGAPGVGAPVLASGPNFVSLPGYRELLSGRADGVCTSNFCAHTTDRTFLDELGRFEHLPPEQVAVIASWERLDRVAARDDASVTVSAGRHAGPSRDRLRVNARASALLDEAAHAHAYPGFFDYRPDRYTAALALEYVQAVRPRFLHVALGDTDEHAHRGDYQGYVDSLREADRFVGQLWRTVQAIEGYGEETTIVVTADHGRASSFRGHGGRDSARVWLFAAGGAIEPRGAVAASRPIHLADVAPTMRALIGLPPESSPHAGMPIDAMLALPPPPGPVMAARAARSARGQ
jgi:hypothetical protein